MGSFIKNELEPFAYLIFAVGTFLQYRRENLIIRKALFLFYCFSTLALAYASKIAWDENDNNNWIYNIHYITSCIFFGYYFYNILIFKKSKTFCLLLYGIGFIVIIITSYFLKNTWFNSFGSSLLFIIIVCSCFFYFRQLFLSPKEESLFLTFDVWLVSGYLLYFLGGFFVILTYNYFSYRLPYEKQYLLADIWAVQNVLLLIASILTLSGYLWISSRKAQ